MRTPQSSVELQIFGLDTEKSRDVSLRAEFTRQDNLTVPRLSVAMSYDIGQRLDYAYAVFVDLENLVRAETFIEGVPQSTQFASTIGDILSLSVDVPQQFRVGETSVDSMMIQQHRFVDGFWWPATTSSVTYLPRCDSLQPRIPDMIFVKRHPSKV